MGLPTDFPFFSGDPDDDKAERPGSWLKRLERTWKSTTSDADKIHDFETSLDADSIAEVWWNKLDVTKKGTWNDVKTAFRTEWPPANIIEISSTAKRATMMSYKLLEEDIGKMEGEGRKRNYTHTIWADKVEPLWKQLEDKNGLLIPEIRANLPQSVIDCIPDVKDINTDFAIFLQAVRDIPVDKMVRRTEELKELRDIKRQLSSLTETPKAPPSPMSQITQRFASSSLYPQYTYRAATQQPVPAPAPIPTTTLATPYVIPHRRQTPPHMTTPNRQQPTPTSNTNPFQDDGTTPRMVNSFYQNLQNTPSPTPRNNDSMALAYLAVQNSRLYNDDEAGQRQYAKDMATWETVYGVNAQMTWMREHLPLTPGTVALGSQECYGCGKIGHTTRDCPLPLEERINPRERQWRTYVTKILFPIGSRGTPIRRTQSQPQQNPMVAQINTNDNELWEYDPYLYPIETVSFHDVEQGNGTESRE
jgi:hypothetical protein